MNKLLALASALFLVCGFTVAAYAQGSAAKEITLAHAHAMMAQGASGVGMAHTHLHHVINCLVGSDGDGFDAAAGNPCKGVGDGAIPDSQGNPTLHRKLESALMHAQAGLQADELSAVQKHAAEAAAALGDTSEQKSSGGYSW